MQAVTVFRHFLIVCLISISVNIYAQDSTVIANRFTQLKSLKDDTAKVNALMREGRNNNKYYFNKDGENPFFQEAIIIAQKIHYPKALAEAYNDIGTAKRNKSEYILALDLHTRAYKNAEESKDLKTISFSLNNMGVDYRRLDDLENAFNCHLKALQVAEKIHDTRNICVATNSIGNIQLTAGKYKEAIKHFEEALALETKSGNKLGMAINLGNIGYGYQYLGQLDKAIDFYKRSLAVNIELENPTGMSICYTALGSAYQEKKDYNTAMKYLSQSLAVNHKVDDKIHTAENYLEIGKLLTEQRKFESAREYIKQALDLGEQYHFKSVLEDAFKVLADNFKASGNYQASLDNLNKSLLYKDSLVNEKSTTAFAQMQAIYEVDRKDNQIKILQHEQEVSQLRMKRNLAWIISLGGFLVMLIILGFFYLRHRNSQAKRLALQLELKALRSQMNPHFIFNSLSSIHRYIWSNNQEQASDYLTKFSKLMRMILENSQHTFVQLNNELDSLELYLDLEALRCNHKFEYSIRLSNNIHPEDILVPPLIIQPYVENAIWHGLVHLDGQGQLEIDISLEGKLLYCKVRDNGIGRKRAMEIKAQKARTHHSMGMTVTESRVDLIKKTNNVKETNVKIIDLYDSSGEAAGTEVIIVLPVEFVF